MQNNQDITGDSSQINIHSSVVNDLLAHWKDLGAIVSSSMKMSVPD